MCKCLTVMRLTFFFLYVSHTQLDALSPAVDVLVRDLPESSTREKAVLTLKTAVEV